MPVSRLLVVALAAATALMLSGCAGGAGDAPAVDPVGTWGDPAAPGTPSLELFDDGTATGTDGCNRLVGGWELEDDGEVDFHGFASTLMACPGVDVWFVGAESARISGDRMTVIADGGVILGTLERGGGATPAPGAGTGGTNSSASPDPSASAGAIAGTGYVGTWGEEADRSPYLVISTDGTYTGSDGCNRMTGRWEIDDDGSLEFDDPALTRMACEGVDQSLSRLDSATIEGDALVVRDDHDAVLATLPRTA
ncbi:META domain-containing protein [Agromyces seonyuensis]|uniref:META domain-containing protein n=1 Tax=Agromyces seonyuensis TaxID=2662446 RepID=A0A6I4NU14_9MICO|nr:META domain-containing protein [Agromyces seonyuensis]MWB97936.1 META domain-containing protein [Agromyces seonyuensis]